MSDIEGIRFDNNTPSTLRGSPVPLPRLITAPVMTVTTRARLAQAQPQLRWRPWVELRRSVDPALAHSSRSLAPDAVRSVRYSMYSTDSNPHFFERIQDLRHSGPFETVPGGWTSHRAVTVQCGTTPTFSGLRIFFTNSALSSAQQVIGDVE